ncbi:MAG: hypothetical protein KIG95_10380, partial [Comamonas sp.]|nr:hypothetical protein [Comamonas sp.]
VAIPDLDADPEAFTVAQFFADNISSGKRIEDGLRNWANLIKQQIQTQRNNQSQSGMFGAKPTLSRGQIFDRLNPSGNPDGNSTAAFTQNHAAPSTEPAQAPNFSHPLDAQSQQQEGEQYEQRKEYPSGIPAGLPAQRNAETAKLEREINRELRRIGQPDGFQAAIVEETQLSDALSRALGAFRRATGTRVAVFRNLTPEVFNFNGVNFRDGVAWVNEASEHPLTLTAAHEWLHNLKRTDPAIYQSLAREVIRQGDLTGWAHVLREQGEGRWRDMDLVTEELTAAAVSDALTDPAFLQRLAQRDQSTFKRVARAFLDFLNTLTAQWKDQGSNAYLRDVEAFRDKLEQILDALPQHSEQQASKPTPSATELSALDAKEVRQHARELGLPVMDGLRPLKKSELIAAIGQQQGKADQVQEAADKAPLTQSDEEMLATLNNAVNNLIDAVDNRQSPNEIQIKARGIFNDLALKASPTLRLKLRSSLANTPIGRYVHDTGTMFIHADNPHSAWAMAVHEGDTLAVLDAMAANPREVGRANAIAAKTIKALFTGSNAITLPTIEFDELDGNRQGTFNTKHHRVTLNPKSATSTTVLHELMHAATVSGLFFTHRVANARGNIPKGDIARAKALIELLESVVKQLGIKKHPGLTGSNYLYELFAEITGADTMIAANSAVFERSGLSKEAANLLQTLEKKQEKSSIGDVIVGIIRSTLSFINPSFTAKVSDKNISHVIGLLTAETADITRQVLAAQSARSSQIDATTHQAPKFSRSASTQARQRMTDAERRATPPSATADVADSDVIVTFNGKEMHSAPLPANAAQVQEQATPRTPVTAIRAALTKAYGKLLDKLEAKGLVTLTQTQEEAIDAAAQARAAITGQSVESIKQSLMASVQNQIAYHGTPWRG